MRLVAQKPHTFDRFKFSRFCFLLLLPVLLLDSVPFLDFYQNFMAGWPFTLCLMFIG